MESGALTEVETCWDLRRLEVANRWRWFGQVGVLRRVKWVCRRWGHVRSSSSSSRSGWRFVF